MDMCKILEILTVLLLLIGGLNWGLVGLFNFDVVAAIFGAGTGAARLVYILVGLSAVYKIASWKHSGCNVCK